jgi:hypothetical protein
MADQPAEVILGVDTHAQAHVACLLDHLGRLQGRLAIPATRAGSQQLLAWTARHGRLTRAGVEGTGTYGAGLTRSLTRAGVKVLEVDRPNRQRRRRRGKSDPTDAGDNPDRLHPEAALAASCGASPVEASSGKTVRHRLNRGGDRQANNALWVIALTRLRDDPATAPTPSGAPSKARPPRTPCAASTLPRPRAPAAAQGRPPGRCPTQLDIGASNRSSARGRTWPAGPRPCPGRRPPRAGSRRRRPCATGRR